MSTVKPELISIESIEIYSSTINTSDDYLNNPMKMVKAKLTFTFDLAYNIEEKNLRVRMPIKISAENEDAESIGLTGEFGIEIKFHVENLDEFVQNKNDKVVFKSTLGATIIGMVYSTVRGILFAHTRATAFEGLILPVVDPNHLLKAVNTDDPS